MSSKCPLVSVVTTVYNTEKYVDRCFNSIMEQSYPNIELIVVDNASKGNIAEIVKTYQEAYPERTIKFLQFEENQGVFNARVQGAEIATGDYITFIDSDDRISLDYYRRLIQHAEKTGSDMVAGDFVFESDTNFCYYHNYNGIRTVDFTYHNEEVRNFFFEQHGLAFYWNLVWNKIYSRELWQKAYPHLKKNKKKIVMCDDMGITCVLYCFSKHYENIHDVYYYYLRTGNGSSDGGTSLKKFKSILDDVYNVFEFMEEFLSKNFDNLLPKFNKWKKAYAKVWCREVYVSPLPAIKKKILFDKVKKIFQINKVEIATPVDDFFHLRTTPHNDTHEKIICEILSSDTEIVSFDIFDTLLVRPLWSPEDLFQLLKNNLTHILPDHYVSIFPQLRLEADRLARSKALLKSSSFRDVTIDEIYEEFKTITNLADDVIDQVKSKEINLELEICYPRECAKKLYELAVSKSKKIICVTDMYLPKVAINELLHKNGYDRIDEIFVSSEYRTPKSDGLFKYVLKEMGVTSGKSIIHIGDNYYCDVIIPQKYKIRAFHMTKAVEMMQNLNQTYYAGNAFNKIYVYKTDFTTDESPLWFLRNRCMLALVANKIYDNPWISFNGDSDFNGDPYFIGYFVLGFFVDAIIQWLVQNLHNFDYNSIQFIARDGFIIKKAYDFYKNLIDNKLPDSNYLYASRKALLPLLIENADDLFEIVSFDDISKLSPASILSFLKDIIPKSKHEQDTILLENKIDGKANFNSIFDWNKFVNVFRENFVDSDYITSYRKKMMLALRKEISGKACSFDIGYSGRTELVFSKYLENPMDAFYIYLRKERAEQSAHKGRFNISSYFEYLPPMVGSMVIEMMLSYDGPSCNRLSVDKSNRVVPHFQEDRTNFQTSYMINIIQSAALEFIHDVYQLESAIGKIPCYSSYESVKPFNFYIYHSQYFDRSPFAACQFSNGLFDETEDLLSRWNCIVSNPCEILPATAYLPKWKKAIILALTDRKLLKEKIKNKYSNHPIFLKILGVGYSIPRSIYHLLKNGRAG